MVEPKFSTTPEVCVGIEKRGLHHGEEAQWTKETKFRAALEAYKGGLEITEVAAERDELYRKAGHQQV
jgi:hypothetical protein